jgi:hypothetical protein
MRKSWDIEMTTCNHCVTCNFAWKSDGRAWSHLSLVNATFIKRLTKRWREDIIWSQCNSTLARMPHCACEDQIQIHSISIGNATCRRLLNLTLCEAIVGTWRNADRLNMIRWRVGAERQPPERPRFRLQVVDRAAVLTAARIPIFPKLTLSSVIIMVCMPNFTSRLEQLMWSK